MIERSGAVSGAAISAAAMSAERSTYRRDAVMVKTCEDRLTHCGHSLDAVFPLTADRSNFTVAQKRSDQLGTARL